MTLNSIANLKAFPGIIQYSGLLLQSSNTRVPVLGKKSGLTPATCRPWEVAAPVSVCLHVHRVKEIKVILNSTQAPGRWF